MHGAHWVQICTCFNGALRGSDLYVFTVWDVWLMSVEEWMRYISTLVAHFVGPPRAVDRESCDNYGLEAILFPCNAARATATYVHTLAACVLRTTRRLINRCHWKTAHHSDTNQLTNTTVSGYKSNLERKNYSPKELKHWFRVLYS